jgi:hypothetical protein
MVILVGLPASAASAADLGELLDESREASYTAEQVISCSTPDGVRDAVVEISQVGGELHVGATADPDVEVASGYGGWSLVREGAVVSSANVQATTGVAETRYTVDDGEAIEYLGRPATLYHMIGDGVIRAELVLDDEFGVLLRVATFTADGELYCERRFISFDPMTSSETADVGSEPVVVAPDTTADATLPVTLSEFDRLDVYQDDEGFVFAYYSDGFFSFAVFKTRAVVALDGATTVAVGEHIYSRSFSPGQAMFAWETRDGGMALVGDLPPDMHEAVLIALPAPGEPGLLQRLWRTLFG